MKPPSFWAGWSVGSLAITKSRSSGPDTTISPRGAHSSQGLARGASKTTPLDDEEDRSLDTEADPFQNPARDADRNRTASLPAAFALYRSASASLSNSDISRQTRSSCVQDDVSHRVAMSIFDLLETIKIECEDSKAVCRLQAANSTDNPRRFNSPVSASVRAVSSSISIRRRSSVKSIARPTILPG